jgi:hypothetical protein
MKPKCFVGLKKGKTYYIKLSPANGHLAFNPFSFNSQLVVKNPQDQYEDNDEFENVKELPSSTLTANLSMPNDRDVFYYTSTKDDLIGVATEGSTLPKEMAAKYPKEIQSQIYTYTMVMDDKNHNRKLDDDEADDIISIQDGILSGRTTGSFNAKKGHSYFVMVSGYTDTTVPFSLNPYQLTFKPASKNDEDAGDVIKNNTPSKPLALKKLNNYTLGATGYFNAGVPYGDQDWYVLNIDKDSMAKIILSAKSEIDGVISVYQNGKLVRKANYYPNGDAEVLTINLKKGTYYLKINDLYNNASISPYTLHVDF